jgi:hypothetical protein
MSKTMARYLDIEPEFNYIAVFHYVFLAFEASFAGRTGCDNGTGGNKVRIGDDLGFYEAFLEIGMDDPGGFGGSGTNRDGPSSDFFGAGGEVRLESKGSKPGPGKLVKTGFCLA